MPDRPDRSDRFGSNPYRIRQSKSDRGTLGGLAPRSTPIAPIARLFLLKPIRIKQIKKRSG
jgi:hypothetical protein